MPDTEIATEDGTEPDIDDIGGEQDQEQYGPDNRDLPEQLVNAIKAAIVARQTNSMYTRRREVISDRKLRFYERGYQHLSWNESQGAFSIASPGATIFNRAGQSVQCPTYIDDYNIFFPFLRVIMSVLTQSPPGVNFQPNDPSIPEDIDKAKSAEDYAMAFDRMNDVKEIQQEIVRMMGLSGRTVSWTRTETDAQKFGYNQDGTPRTFQRTTIHGTLETKVSITATKMDQNCPYLFIYLDPDVKVAKDKYYWIADKIKAGASAPGESAYERTARLGVLNGTRTQAQIGDSFTHLTSELQAFLRPSEFTGDLYENALDDPGEQDVADDEETGGMRPLTVGEKLKELFPDGCRAVWIGEAYACACSESMDDHIDIQFPYPGDGMFRMAFMEPMLVVQDRFNDNVNWAAEKFDTGAGSTWINAEQEEIDAINSQKAAPNAIRPKKARVGQALDADFFQEKDPQLPETLTQFIEWLQGALPQFMLAAPPSIFGAAMEDQKTASGYAQARAQAMGQLGIIWSRIQRMFARIRYQSALAAGESDAMTGKLTISGGKGQQDITVDLDGLKKGNFGCYPDEDSSFPESTQSKRATLQGLVTMAAQSPVMLQLLDNPDNIEEIKRLNGFEELVLLPAEARNKQLWELEQLLASAPIGPTPQEIEAAHVQAASAALVARSQGSPEPPPIDPMSMMKPSVPVDPDFDYHQWEYEKCQEWLSSCVRREEDKKGNQAGIENVRLHALQHKKFAMLQAAQAQAALPPPVPPHGAPKAPMPHGGPPSGAGPQSGPSAPSAPPAMS